MSRLVNEEEWKSALKTTRNFTGYMSGEGPNGGSAEYTIKSDNGLFWTSYVTTNDSGKEDRGEAITEITGEAGEDGSSTVYAYDNALDL